MENLSFISCDPLVGLPRVPMQAFQPDVKDLLQEMQRLHVSKAIVRHRACIENAPYFGNGVLMEEIEGNEELVPAWILTCDGNAPDFDIRAIVNEMTAKGVKAAWFSPENHLYSPKPWCSGRLYAALSEKRIPLLVDYNVLPPDDTDEICSAFPELRLLLLNVPRVGRNRMLYPLLERHANIYVCFNQLFSVHEGYPDLVKNFGIRRWVFGTGYPASEGGAAITGLMYSGLSEAAIRAVAYENIERLLSEAAV